MSRATLTTAMAIAARNTERLPGRRRPAPRHGQQPGGEQHRHHPERVRTRAEPEQRARGEQQHRGRDHRATRADPVRQPDHLLPQIVLDVRHHVREVGAEPEQRTGRDHPRTAATAGPASPSSTKAGSAPNATAYGSGDSGVAFRPRLYDQAAATPDQVRRRRPPAAPRTTAVRPRPERSRRATRTVRDGYDAGGHRLVGPARGDVAAAVDDVVAPADRQLPGQDRGQHPQRARAPRPAARAKALAMQVTATVGSGWHARSRPTQRLRPSAQYRSGRVTRESAQRPGPVRRPGRRPGGTGAGRSRCCTGSPRLVPGWSRPRPGRVRCCSTWPAAAGCSRRTSPAGLPARRLDLSAPSLAVAREHGVAPVRADARSLPFADGSRRRRRAPASASSTFRTCRGWSPRCAGCCGRAGRWWPTRSRTPDRPVHRGHARRTAARRPATGAARPGAVRGPAAAGRRVRPARCGPASCPGCGRRCRRRRLAAPAGARSRGWSGPGRRSCCSRPSASNWSRYPSEGEDPV